MRPSIACLLLLLPASAFSRLGDTRDQAEARYGLEKSETSPKSSTLLPGALELKFEFHGWIIRCALLRATDEKDYVVREEYRKSGTRRWRKRAA